MTEKIGNVTLDYEFYPGQDFYCDGAIEDELLSIVKENKEEAFPQIIREKRSWEVLYHLSDLRENIVEWLPLDKNMKVLEVGSGCGAITGSLARRVGSVTCVDLSKKRSLINAYRHQELDNITIHVGNFSDIEPTLDCDYDYVCLIGVFEYGQSYIGGEHPFHDFYTIIKKHVKAGGHIAIAIENKMGLKYWAGCREDHLGTFFSGIEDYPDGGVVRTFTKGGLEKILTECGEKDFAFYYPYPDYKFMTMVYSDRYLPKVSELTNNLRNFDRDRMLLFDEKKVFDMVIREGLFPLYANSYMVVCGPQLEIAYSRFSNDRAAHLAIRTDIGENKDGRYVRKYPANPAAAAHINGLTGNYSALEKRFADSSLAVNKLSAGEENGQPYAELEFLEHTVTLEEKLDECLAKNNREAFRALFDRYLQIVHWNVEAGVQNDDLIFANICIQENEEGGDIWTLIDCEWVSDDKDPKSVVQRALYCYVLENENRRKNAILQAILDENGMNEAVYAQIAQKERDFQQFVMTQGEKKRTAVTDLRALIGHKAVPVKEYFANAERKKVQIFEDLGSGYSQENSWYSYEAYLADDWVMAKVACKEGMTGVRIDPAEVPCIVRIKKVAIDGRSLSAQECAQALAINGKILGERTPASGLQGRLERAYKKAKRVYKRVKGACLQDKEAQNALQSAAAPQLINTSLFFAHNDPNINIRLDALGIIAKEGMELTVEMEIAWLTEGMLKDMAQL
ncbi:MAG: class I SAM-dependent methyltransferase [Lachnospiraceae bacterium]|nr:class I SAM-dependent methyltransferase [Lachnospiraceae bacterium]